MPGVPFDTKLRVVPSKSGRVLTAATADQVVPGLYVAGWLKRGPTGIIGSNIGDAQETVDSICTDATAQPRTEVGFKFQNDDVSIVLLHMFVL